MTNTSVLQMMAWTGRCADKYLGERMEAVGWFSLLKSSQKNMMVCLTINNSVIKTRLDEKDF